MEGIKRIPNTVVISCFIITFSYETKKGYYREQQREIYSTDEAIAKWNFNVWVNKQRTMFNAKILSIVENTKKSKTIDV